MRITVINVGYGDAILFQAKYGGTVLLDGGSALPEEFQGSPYRIPAAAYLQAQGIRRLDAVLISHIHEDHVCGLEPVFRQASVGRLFVPYPVEPFLKGRDIQPGPDAPRSVPLYASALNAYRRLLLAASEAGIPITVLKAGDTAEPARGLHMQVLAPKAAVTERYLSLVVQLYQTEDPALTTELLGLLDGMSNRTSLLLRFQAEGTVFLAAADSCPCGWDGVSKNLLENVNVLKLPHHGQIDSIDEHLMAKMPLSHVITTSASDRRYNSANPGVYQRLSALYPADRQPQFLFSDEREYPPYFSQPDGFQAITLVMDSGRVTPEFVKIHKKEK